MSSDIPLRTRQAVVDRDQRTCQRCGKPGQSIHHRAGRRTHDMANLVMVCGDGTRGCHGWIEAHPFQARETGWKVSRHRHQDGTYDEPEEVPLTRLDGSSFWLTSDGARLSLGDLVIA